MAPRSRTLKMGMTQKVFFVHLCLTRWQVWKIFWMNIVTICNTITPLTIFQPKIYIFVKQLFQASLLQMTKKRGVTCFLRGETNKRKIFCSPWRCWELRYSSNFGSDIGVTGWLTHALLGNDSVFLEKGKKAHKTILHEKGSSWAWSWKFKLNDCKCNFILGRD